jgi:hypothetical protein
MLYAGGAVWDCQNTDYSPSGTFILLRAAYAGASSFITVNNGAPTIGNPGALAPTAAVIAATYFGEFLYFSHIQLLEYFAYSRILSAPEATQAWEAMALKYSLPQPNVCPPGVCVLTLNASQGITKEDDAVLFWEDQSLYGNHAVPNTLLQAPTHYADGLQFNSAHSMRIGNSVNLNPTNATGITMAAWLKPATQPSANGDAVVKCHGGYSGQYSITIVQSGENIYARFYHAIPEEEGVNTKNPLTLNAWVHIVATYDGSIFKLYKNGYLDNTQETPGTFTIWDDSLFLGSDLGAVSFYNGRLDRIRLYTKVLTPTEVLALYNEYTPS